MWIYYLVLLAAIVILLLNGIRIVPAVHYGIVMRFGKRTGTVLTEGLHFVIPFADSVMLFGFKLDPKIIQLNFFSRDNLEVILRALIQWRPDWKVKTKEGLNKFIENKEETVTSGISEAIKSLIGTIIGQVKAEVFIREKKAIERYISCVLRLEVPPHVNPSLIDPNLEGEEIKDAKKRLEFYKKYSNQINELLRHESEINKRSELEGRYGIDIIAFDMGDVDFSPKTREALELEMQTENKLKADQLELNKKLQMVEKLKELGIDSQTALNSAEVTMDQAEKKIHSVEVSGLLSLLEKLINLFDKGKKKGR